MRVQNGLSTKSFQEALEHFKKHLGNLRLDRSRFEEVYGRFFNLDGNAKSEISEGDQADPMVIEILNHYEFVDASRNLEFIRSL